LQDMYYFSLFLLHEYLKCPTMQTIIRGAEFVAGLFTTRRLPLRGQRPTTGESQRPLSGGLFLRCR
jgi:hypothetical protein